MGTIKVLYLPLFKFLERNREDRRFWTKL
jgi:hypothetical protein